MASPTVTALTARVQALCRPVTSVTTSDIEAALVAANLEISAKAPQHKYGSVTLVDGVGDLTDLLDWASGESWVSAVEYPLGDVPRTILHPTLWEVLDDTLTVYEGGGYTVRVFYRTNHVIDTGVGDSTTYTTVQGEAAALTASAIVLESLAARWGQAQSVAVAGDEYAGPSVETLNRTAQAFRDRSAGLLVRAAVTVGYEPRGEGFSPDPF